MLRPGDLIPHFHVTNVQGEQIAYSDIWQRRALVMVILPGSDADGSVATYVAHLTPHIPTLKEYGAACVVTREVLDGIPSPGVVIADRWGEIVHVGGGHGSHDLPLGEHLVEWASYIQRQCPECEGESK